MFSATFPEEIQKLGHDFLRAQFAFVAVGVVGGANRDITQSLEQVGQYDKKDRLVELLREDVKNAELDGGGSSVCCCILVPSVRLCFREQVRQEDAGVCGAQAHGRLCGESAVAAGAEGDEHPRVSEW